MRSVQTRVYHIKLLYPIHVTCRTSVRTLYVQLLPDKYNTITYNVYVTTVRARKRRRFDSDMSYVCSFYYTVLTGGVYRERTTRNIIINFIPRVLTKDFFSIFIQLLVVLSPRTGLSITPRRLYATRAVQSSAGEGGNKNATHAHAHAFSSH